MRRLITNFSIYVNVCKKIDFFLHIPLIYFPFFLGYIQNLVLKFHIDFLDSFLESGKFGSLFFNIQLCYHPKVGDIKAILHIVSMSAKRCTLFPGGK